MHFLWFFIPLLFWFLFQIFFPMLLLLLNYYTIFLAVRFNILKLRVIFAGRVMLENWCLWSSKIFLKTRNLSAHSTVGNRNKPVLWLLGVGGHLIHLVKSAFALSLVWVRLSFKERHNIFCCWHSEIYNPSILFQGWAVISIKNMFLIFICILVHISALFLLCVSLLRSYSFWYSFLPL